MNRVAVYTGLADVTPVALATGQVAVLKVGDQAVALMPAPSTPAVPAGDSLLIGALFINDPRPTGMENLLITHTAGTVLVPNRRRSYVHATVPSGGAGPPWAVTGGWYSVRLTAPLAAGWTVTGADAAGTPVQDPVKDPIVTVYPGALGTTARQSFTPTVSPSSFTWAWTGVVLATHAIRQNGTFAWGNLTARDSHTVPTSFGNGTVTLSRAPLASGTATPATYTRPNVAGGDVATGTASVYEYPNLTVNP